jgi:hypothetical protein
MSDRVEELIEVVTKENKAPVTFGKNIIGLEIKLTME